MRKVVLLMIFICVFASGCAIHHTSQRTGLHPRDFNLAFAYGVGGKNKLDTFAGKFTADMVVDPPITIKLKFSNDEKNLILEKMDQIDLWNYPEAVTIPDARSRYEPHMSFSLRVVNPHDGRIKSVSWEGGVFTDNIDEEPVTQKLNQLATLIRNIIDAKPEVKRLPKPRGAYM